MDHHQPSDCPFSGANAQPAQQSAQPATCPFSGAKTADALPATCPLGYAAGNAPQLTDLHCVLCKLYLHDPVSTNCSHIFCRGCIVRFAECPLCGADVQHLEPDTARNGAIIASIMEMTDTSAQSKWSAFCNTTRVQTPLPSLLPGMPPCR